MNDVYDWSVRMLGGVYVPNFTPNYKSLHIPSLLKGVVLPVNVPQEVVDSLKGYYVERDAVRATFYKNVVDVQDAERSGERYIHQFLHYLSTYGGCDFIRNDGDVFSMNPSHDFDGMKDEFDALPPVKVVRFYSREEFTEKLLKVAYSNTALSSDDVEDVIRVFAHYNIECDVNKVLNKELHASLILLAGGVPRTVDELVRVIVYALVGVTTVVKNKKLYASLSASDHPRVDISGVIQRFVAVNGERKLSSGSNRYRKILMIARKFVNPETRTLLNRVLKGAKKTGSDFTAPIVNRMFDDSVDEKVRRDAVPSFTTGQIVRLIESHRRRETVNASKFKVIQHRVRNTKTFIRQVSSTLPVLPDSVLDTLWSELVDRYRTLFNGQTVFIPEGVDYAIPSSLKNMVGAYPEFTKFTVTEGAFSVGVYWDWNADIDLHSADISGETLGWNSSFSDGKMTYSGDMTSLNREGWASEFFHFSEAPQGVSVTARMYSDRQFGINKIARFIISQASKLGEFADLSRSLAHFPIPYVDGKNVGSMFITSNDGEANIYLVGRSASQVAPVPDVDTSVVRARAYENEMGSRVYLREVLERAGVNVTSEMTEGAVDLSPEVFDVSTILVN